MRTRKPSTVDATRDARIQVARNAGPPLDGRRLLYLVQHPMWWHASARHWWHRMVRDSHERAGRLAAETIAREQIESAWVE